MNYQKYADKAYEKIKQYGSFCKVIQAGGKQYNAETDEYESTESKLTGYALETNNKQSNMASENVRFSDVFLLCVLSGKPQSNDEIIFGDNTYTIVDVQTFSPDGNAKIYYKVQAR